MKKILTLLFLSCWYFNLVGATLTVCPSGCGYTTIAAALSAASDGDIIHVNVTGYHTENAILINKSVTIKGNGKAQTFIQGAATRLSAADRVFNIPRTQAGTTLDNALTVTFEDLTIQNGYASFQSSNQFSFGGGIQINNGNGSVYNFTNVDFKTNDTRTSCPAACSNGGGAGMYISCTSGNAILGDNTVIINLTNCVFDDNNTGTATANSSGSGQQGGAIQMNARGTVIANRCSFINNTAFTSGGVMYNGSAIVGSFTNCKFEGNNVTEPAATGFQGSSFSGTGGGFGIRSSVFAFTNCSFKNNSSPSMGGAVWGGSAHSFTNCTFYGNSSQYGGAIYRMNGTANSTMSVINCTFAGNTASVAGRAIIVGNHAPTTTSIYNIALINTIINTNSGAAASDIHFYTDYNRLTVNQKNYVNSFTGVGTAPTFDYNSGNSTLGLAAAPANNGGTIETMALDNTSTLVDVGTNNVSGYSIPVKDARNYSRTDAGVDIGAYEKAGIIDDAVAPAITYTVLANTPLTTDRTLTATITDANGVYPWSNLVPRIYFKKGTGGSWQSTAGTLTTGTGRNGTWTFNITNASMGGVTSGDVIYYYVIAQDVSTAKSLASNPSGVSAVDVNTVSTPPGTPNSYTIGSACNAPTVPTLSATSSSICSGASTTLSIATGTLNDATGWQWYSGSCGGTSVGSGTSISVSPTSTTTYYARGEGGCVTPGSCGSVAITVTATVTPSVTIASSDADNKICAGTSVTFTPTPTNGGSSPAYQWKLNGNNVSTAATYTTTALANGDEVTVQLTSNATCASPTTATSSGITTTVDANVTPSVTLASSDADNKICAGTSVTFTPTPTNGGASPAYQWKLNGNNVSTAAMYTTTTLANNDVVTVVLTSNALCASPTTATSAGITTTVDATVTPSVTIASSDADNKICAGTSVTFTPTPTNGGASPSYQWKLNGNNVSTAATYTTTTLANNDAVTVVLTSNALCASPATATSTGITTTVDAVVIPSVTIASSDADNKICAGASVTFTPTPTNGGSSPAYQWKLNGNNVSTAATYTTTTLANNDAVTVVLTSNAVCASPTTATSAGITTTVDATVTPSVTIASSDADNKICAGTSVTFTPTPMNGGASPAYQWKVNGSNVSTAATYTTTSLTNNAIVTVVMTSNAVCPSPATATSAGITTTVDATVTPSVAIASSDADNKICAGTSVTFTPTPTNGGASPSYQWKLNGNNVSTAATYTTTTLANNDAVTVILTSNALCASPATATSTGITTTVDAVVIPSVTIASSDADNKICADASVTFTPTPTNGGSSPAYQWKLNGNDVATGVTYTTTTLANNDIVTVVLTSNALCVSPATATSAGITTTVDPLQVPAVTISSNVPNNEICTGASVTFTPSPVNGGSSPTYQWKLNGNNVSTASTYTTTSLANNDEVSVILTSDALCAYPPATTSNVIKMKVNTVVAPSVSITSDDADNLICAGTKVTFTPTPGNGGTAPAYQWKLNGNNVATTTTYVTDSLKKNDVVNVVMTSNSGCASPTTATSNSITTNVNQPSTADITKVACDSVKFDTKTYTASGTYTVHLINALGCDSMVTLHVTIHKSSKNTITETACDSIRFDNKTYTSSGVYTVILKNKAGCDSTVTLNLTIPKSTTATITETGCDSIHFDNKTYTSSGVYTVKLKNKAGCDSIVTLNLTIHKSTMVSVTKVACDSLLFNNQTYKVSGIYVIKLKNAAKCDSTITLDLAIHKTTTHTLTETACDSLRFDNKTYTASGTYTAILKNKAGCDSVVTLHLTINKTTISNHSETACDSLQFINQTYTASGVYMVVTKNKAGCDSTITLNVTIHKSSKTVLTETACDSLIFNGQKYTASGVYTAKLKNMAGCDSTITLYLTINHSNAYTLVKTACGSFTLNSQTYTTSGTYTQLVKNVAGCDSVITLQLTIKPGSNNGTTITPVACDKFELNGQTYTSSGLYKQTLTNAGGCDSILTIQLTILHSTAYTLVKTACNSFVLNGQTYMDSGVFTQKLKNSVGCDSILTIQLTIEHLTATATVSNNILTANTTGAVYQWINCNGNTAIPGATGQSFAPTASGSYAVIISASTCTDTSICYPIVISGIDDADKNQYGLTVYPNPNNGSFMIHAETQGSFFIVNELGQVVRTFTLNAANNYSIGISELESGMYMIQGMNAISTTHYKLVVTGIK